MENSSSTAELEGMGRPPNWLFFSGVYAGILLAGLAIEEALRLLLNFELPSAISFLLFYLAAHIAGKNYCGASSGRWSPRDRHRLAMVYSGVGLLISAMGTAIVSIFDPAVRGVLGMVSQLWFAVLATVVLIVVAVAQYGIARWIFAQLDKQADRRAARAAQRTILGDQ